VTSGKCAGWIVTCHHEDILTFVDPSEFAPGPHSDLTIGMHGRIKRDKDASELEVIHVETHRA
jgi:hypothetical protein